MRIYELEKPPSTHGRIDIAELRELLGQKAQRKDNYSNAFFYTRSKSRIRVTIAHGAKSLRSEPTAHRCDSPQKVTDA
jgi:hypothetical protein